MGWLCPGLGYALPLPLYKTLRSRYSLEQPWAVLKGSTPWAKPSPDLYLKIKYRKS